MNTEKPKKELPETGTRIYRLLRPHRHSVPGMEILFVLAGKVHVEAADMTYKLGESDILLLSRCIAVNIRPVSIDPRENCLVSILRIAPSFLSFAFGDDIPAFVCNTTNQKNKDFTALRGMLAEIACNDTVGSDDNSNTLLLNSVLFRVLCELRQNYAVSGEGSDTNEDGESRRERKIAAFINKNYRYPLTLEELSKKLRLTPQYLSRYFKKCFGITFHDYLNKIRLESAIKDLILTEKTVTAVAYDNGFPNLNSFINTLKNSTGKTPAEYRKAHKTKEHKIVKGIIIEENAESNLIQEKLRPYLHAKKDIIYQEEHIIIDANARKSVHYERPWEDTINLGFANDFTKAAFFDQISLLQKETPFCYGRFHGLFEESALVVKEPLQEYNFVRIDRIINFLYQVKLIPFVELGFKPYLIQGKHGEYIFNINREIQNIPCNRYEDLIEKFLKHMVNRYGLQEVNRWRFEMMVPAEDNLDYTKSDIDTYVEQFIRIKKIIRDIAPYAQMGGPGFNLTRPENLDIMTKILHSLKEQGCSPDFFSFYAFSFSPMLTADESAKNILLWEKRETVRRIIWAKEFIQSLDPSIKKFFVTEWNLDFSCRNRLHDCLIKAPFILQNNIDAIGTMDALCYWLASDISAEYSDSSAILFGGAGLLSRPGIRKPSFFAYHFLSALGPVLLAKGEGYIVTEKSENNYTAIVFNYKYISNQSRLRNDFHELSRDPQEFLENKNKLVVSLRIDNIYPGKYKVKSHILTNHWGSVYDTWKGMSAVEGLSDSEASWLERTCVPALRIDFLEGTENIAMECELEPNEVRLLEISLILE
jgi:beta-xylosidase/AraC-like DNA-binding protein